MSDLKDRACKCLDALTHLRYPEVCGRGFGKTIEEAVEFAYKRYLDNGGRACWASVYSAQEVSSTDYEPFTRKQDASGFQRDTQGFEVLVLGSNAKAPVQEVPVALPVLEKPQPFVDLLASLDMKDQERRNRRGIKR